jgi:hypothetical protein
MWKQYTNIILGILVAVMAVSGVATAWIVCAGALTALMALSSIFSEERYVVHV